MITLIDYIVASTISLGIFYIAFIVFLRKEPLFRFNRIYLLSALLFSFLIPLITLLPDSFLFIKADAPVNGFIQSFTLSPVVISATASKIPSLPGILGYIYLIGVSYFAVRLIIRLVSIYNLGKNGSRTDINESSVLWSESTIPPFSFFRTMYLPVNLKDTSHLNEVIRHEQVHINSLHSFDIVFTQVMQIFCWVNPFIPLIEKSLREIHEFEADRAVIHAGTDPVAYTKILFEHDKTALAVVLGNNFNYSLIKRRLTMFYKKSTRFAKLKAIVVLPIVASIVLIYTIGCKPSVNKETIVSGTTDTLLVSHDLLEKGGRLDTIKFDTIIIKDGKRIKGSAIVLPPPPPPPPPPTKSSLAEPPPPPPPPPIGTKDANGVYTVVDNMPHFPGGEKARIDYMVKNVKYPEAAKEKKAEGMVIVSFIVEEDGSINKVKVVRGIEKSCDEEALRVIKGMPKWIPGSQNGKPVKVMFSIPIQFKLN